MVEEIPPGRSGNLWTDRKADRAGEEFQIGGEGAVSVGNYGEFPCYRVVNHMGRLAPGWAEQEWLLKGEGVTLKENGCVDLKKYLWEC